MDMVEERVVMETDRHRIEGRLTLPREGYRSRLSDYVNQPDRDFLSVSGATVLPLDGDGPGEPYEFLLVARAHIRLIAEDAP